MTSVTLPAARRERSIAPSRLGLELALFAGLGAMGVLQWSRLVADSPLGRLLVGLAIITAGAGLLGRLARNRPRVLAAAVGAAAIVVVSTVAAMVAVGLPAGLLWVGNWPELVDNLSLGLAGVEDTNMPYAGNDVWLRLTLLLIAPLLLGIAAALAFWPARKRGRLRVLALAVLVAIYTTAVTLDSPVAELLWGIPLLLLIAAWLWVPQLQPGRGAGAMAVVAIAGIAAVPVAARLESPTPWWNYESWDWFGRDREVTFDWNHSYGPLDWPREGTTLLEARSTETLYWKASVLDRFDGFTWQRASGSDALGVTERLARRATPGLELPERHRDWLTQATIEVKGLSSRLVIGSGTTLAVSGLGHEVRASADGTLSGDGARLESGDQYSIVSYSPQPTAGELRRAPATYPVKRFASMTLVGLPTVEPEELDGGFAPGRGRRIPLWGTPPGPVLLEDLRGSAYAETYELARRLTADVPTPYAAVRSIESYLRRGYTYSPEVPNRDYPLPAFLFEDRAGYCQQFAGTMALMLRLVGIPSRVVSGFAPGSLDNEGGIYEVRDVDAHSWVEVYFRGIGWVTFDPTPAAAPAASQALNAELASGSFFRGRGAAEAEQQQNRDALGGAGSGGGDAAAADGTGAWPVIAGLLLGGGILAAAVGAVVFWRRRKVLTSGGAVDAQLDELRRAVDRAGWRTPGEMTLLWLERRSRTAGRGAVAHYAGRLRAHRYAPGAPAPPGPIDRRSVRRALAAGGGLRQRLRLLAAIPPGGPARRRT